MVGQGLGNHLAAPSLLVLAVFNFIYYTLDNMDGKQARRTGTSSPLGMLMDHGCDAFGMSFIVLAVCSIIMLKDPATILYTAQAGVMFTFWASVWAQYHSNGIMILGKVNAVDDGIPLISLLAVISWFCGQDWWVSPFFEGITLQWVLVRGIQFSSVGRECPMCSSDIFSCTQRGVELHQGLPACFLPPAAYRHDRLFALGNHHVHKLA